LGWFKKGEFWRTKGREEKIDRGVLEKNRKS
jgi:hypothetical protein